MNLVYSQSRNIKCKSEGFSQKVFLNHTFEGLLHFLWVVMGYNNYTFLVNLFLFIFYLKEWNMIQLGKGLGAGAKHVPIIL